MIRKNNEKEIKNNAIDLKTYYNFLANKGKNNEKILDKEETKEYFERIKAGDEKARQEFFEHNIRLVLSVVKKYSAPEKRKTLSLEDIIQEGNIGLCVAIDKFDASKDVKFGSFAFDWIVQGIDNAIDEKSRILSVPKNKINILKKYSQLEYNFKKEHKRQPTFEEIASKMPFTYSTIKECIEIKSEMISLDSEFESKNSIHKTSNLDMISLEQSNDKYSYFIEDDMDKVLNEKEKNVLISLFDLSGEGHKTIEELAEEYNVDVKEIEFEEYKGLLKMRKLLISEL